MQLRLDHHQTLSLRDIAQGTSGAQRCLEQNALPVVITIPALIPWSSTLRLGNRSLVLTRSLLQKGPYSRSMLPPECWPWTDLRRSEAKSECSTASSHHREVRHFQPFLSTIRTRALSLDQKRNLAARQGLSPPPSHARFCQTKHGMPCSFASPRQNYEVRSGFFYFSTISVGYPVDTDHLLLHLPYIRICLASELMSLHSMCPCFHEIRILSSHNTSKPKLGVDGRLEAWAVHALQ